MRISFVSRIIAGLLAVTIVKPALMTAGGTSLTSWQNLEQLISGHAIEVTMRNGRSVQRSGLAPALVWARGSENMLPMRAEGILEILSQRSLASPPGSARGLEHSSDL